MKLLHSKYILLCVLLIFAGCAQSGGEDIVIGGVWSLSGDAADFGTSALQGATLAVEEINAAGGVDGKMLRLVVEDDQTNPVQATNGFQKVVNVDGAVAVIGGEWDFLYNAIAPLAEQTQTPLITTQSPYTKGLVMSDYTFVMLPPLDAITQTLETYIEENQYKRIGVVRFNSEWGAAITQGLKDIAQKTGGEFVAQEVYQSIGGNDFGSEVQKLKTANVDVVFIDMVGSDVLQFLRRAKEAGLDVQILSHQIIKGYLGAPDVDERLLEGIVFFDFSQPASQEFDARYENRWGSPSRFTADNAYDAVYILAQAMASDAPLHVAIAQNSVQTINGHTTFVDNVATARTVHVMQVRKGVAQRLYVVDVQ